MSRSLAAVATIALAVAALASSAPPVSAVDYNGACCACVQSAPFAQSSPAVNRTLSEALFCATAHDGTEALLARCEALDGRLICTKSDGEAQTADSGGSCIELLSLAGIGCPVSPAPAASGANLVTLAVALGALGALLLRRRRRA